MRGAFLLLTLLPGLLAEPVTGPGQYPLQNRSLVTPAGPGAMGGSLTRSADDALYLSWLEPMAGGATALRFARFDASAAGWGPARTVATGRDWFVNWADTPVLAAEPDGRLTAVWPVINAVRPEPPGATDHHGAGYQAWFSRSLDDGVTWSPPCRLTGECDSVEFVSLQPLARGGILAVWLDGRAKQAGAGHMQLRGRVIGPDGADHLIDGSVCDCCQTTLAAFPDGSALVAYRARREDEVRDIHLARFRNGRWEPPRLLNDDGWRIPGCPVNGPRLASAGGRLSAAWFTAADNDARVLAAGSPDAGTRFTQPQRLDLGRPLGRVDTVLLRDGSRLVTWIEATGEKAAGIYLRRLSPADDPGPPVLLADTSRARAGGFPRLALVKDYDATPAQLLLAFTSEGEPSAVETRLLTLPDLSTLAGRKPCLPCDEEDANAVRGYPVKGRVLGADPARDEVLVKHEVIPGVMRAMTMVFKVDPAVLPSLPRGQEFIGRIEKRGRDWWLFNVKLLGAPAR